MTAPLEQRIAAVESDLYRPGSGLLARHTDSARHLTMAVGDLSQQQRGLALDVRDIVTRLDAIDGRLDVLESLVRQVLDRLPARPEDT